MDMGGKGDGEMNELKKRGRWSAVCYENEKFRNIVMTFDCERNLSRFIYRTAKANGMKDLALADVEKMLKAADEVIFVMKGDEDGRREFCGNWRKPTWVMSYDRKQMYRAMMNIVDAGWAETYKREIEIKGETREQRIWELA